MKNLNLLFGVIFIASLCSINSSCQVSKASATVRYKTISSRIDTSIIIVEKMVLVIINEPACTGCKDQLFEFIDKYVVNSKVEVNILLNNTGSLLNKKIYEKYLYNKFKVLKNVYYSNNDEYMSIDISQEVIKTDSKSSPELFFIDIEKKINIEHLTYDDLFTNIYLRENVKTKIKSFAK